VSAGNPYVTVATEPGTNIAVWFELANTYINLGIDHILLGIDHLLFVLGLIWLVRGRWMLVKTITSFTVAHSISLAAATAIVQPMDERRKWAFKVVPNDDLMALAILKHIAKSGAKTLGYIGVSGVGASAAEAHGTLLCRPGF